MLYISFTDPPASQKREAAPEMVVGQFEGGARFDKTTQPSIPVG